MSKYEGFSTLKEMLEEDGTFESVTARATKRALILDIEDAMKSAKLGKSELARKMETSRAQLDRLLSSESTGVTLDTMVKLSNALGRKLQVRLI